MSQEERLLDNTRPGNIKPTVELRESLEEIEKCKKFFEQGGFIDYLNSVNQCYLENQGKVVGPESIITDNVESDNSDDSEMIELSDFVLPQGWGRARAGIVSSLEWQRAVGTKIIEGRISMNLYHKGDNYNFFWLLLYAAYGEKSSEESPILNGRYKRKAFSLNSRSVRSQDVDNLLLAFTSELLGAKIL